MSLVINVFFIEKKKEKKKQSGEKINSNLNRVFLLLFSITGSQMNRYFNL